MRYAAPILLMLAVVLAMGNGPHTFPYGSLYNNGVAVTCTVQNTYYEIPSWTVAGEQNADAQAVVAMAALQGQTVTVAQVAQGAVDRYLASVHDESLKARAAKRVTDAALKAYHARLDAELDAAEKAKKP